MADIPLPFSGARAESVTESASERFLTWPRVAGLAVFGLFALTFDWGRVNDDGTVYYAFLRRLFGADTPAVAYQFGSAFWNAPFYLVSQFVATRGQFSHYHAGEIATAAGSNVAVVFTLYFGWRILRELSLPRGPVVLLLALFGTPLFFYGGMAVSYKHAVDTLYATAAFWFVLRSSRDDARRRDFVAAGICLALLLATRFANFAIVFGVLAAFAVLRLRRAASWIALTGGLTCVLLFVLPVIRHIPYASPPAGLYGMTPSVNDAPAWLAPVSQRYAVSPLHFVEPVWRNTSFSATAPLKMLFTLHRGLFVWTPLTAFATLGFVLVVRRDRQHRPFLLALGASALALVAIHSLWGGQWDAGGSFSQRFLTALFPVFLIGAAEIVRRLEWPGVALLAVCACFSLWIGLVQYNGYFNESGGDSIVTIVGNFRSFLGPKLHSYHTIPPYESLQNFGRQVDALISSRWRLYWRLVT